MVHFSKFILIGPHDNQSLAEWISIFCRVKNRHNIMAYILGEEYWYQHFVLQS